MEIVDCNYMYINQLTNCFRLLWVEKGMTRIWTTDYSIRRIWCCCVPGRLVDVFMTLSMIELDDYDLTVRISHSYAMTMMSEEANLIAIFESNISGKCSYRDLMDFCPIQQMELWKPAQLNDAFGYKTLWIPLREHTFRNRIDYYGQFSVGYLRQWTLCKSKIALLPYSFTAHVQQPSNQPNSLAPQSDFGPFLFG